LSEEYLLIGHPERAKDLFRLLTTLDRCYWVILFREDRRQSGEIDLIGVVLDGDALAWDIDRDALDTRDWGQCVRDGSGAMLATDIGDGEN
jgi:hypothetical protein